MKSQHSFLFCIIILFLFTSDCIAQNNTDRLLSNDKIWSILGFDYAGKKATPYPKYRSQYIRLDSVGSIYFADEGSTNAQLTFLYDFYRSDNEDMSDWYYFGTAWEVDLTQKIYFSIWGSWWDKSLLYDFGAEIGDTLELYDLTTLRGINYYDDRTASYIVDSIDTITIQGIERRRMHLEFDWENSYYSKFDVTWISGIGSERGILYSSGDGIGEDSYSLLCLHQGDSLLYQPYPSFGCYYSTVDVPEKSVEDSPVTIYPNPTNDILYVDSYRGGYLSVIITSLNGQLLLNREIENTSNQIDLSSFQKGVYFITIRSEDFVTTRKIIKL